ncbi:unnamed protein product [Candidula unifasciata]|uniref:Riboflavin transporter n=1 Tax=Candidula unifasciata TaxID=100452 RepID=A0A8S3YVY6_9EUPU|nr:unnamed protein product [Candidula unifasciata]
MARQLCRCGSINLLVFLLVILFGVSSWVDINGLWVELPVLVQHLPEGWDLPSYMSVIIQVANIAPLIYTISSTVWPHRMLEVPVIYVIISLGCVSCLLLAFVWDVTSSIAGVEHSTALFVLQFCLALVDCTSSVAFLPFMSAFKTQYMTAYFIGEGFSGLIPSLVALVQGAGSMKCVKIAHFQNQSAGNETEHDMHISKFVNGTIVFNNSSEFREYSMSNSNKSEFGLSTSVFPVYQEPRFSVQVFFLLLMVLLIVSLLSFTFLNFSSYCQKEKVGTSLEPSVKVISGFSNHDLPIVPSGGIVVKTKDPKADKIYHASINKQYNQRYNSNDVVVDSKSISHLIGSEIDTSSEESDLSIPKSTRAKMAPSKYACFLLLTAFLNAISNGLLPSIQSYSCLPYGIEEFHLSVTLASIANPFACLASFMLKMKSLKWTVVSSIIGTGLTGYIVWTAAASPTPPLVDHTAGPVILILCWILVVFVLTYTKVSIATEFREEGKRALLWIGASTQAGSLLGAVSIFVVVNVFKLFRTGNPCA